MISKYIPISSMQIKAWDLLHLSLVNGVDPLLVTNVHKSNEFLVGQGELVQLNWKFGPERMDSFQYEVLSDHFQLKPVVELTTLPPTQQPLTTSLHRLWAKFNSWNDVNAAKCPPLRLHSFSDSFHDRGLPI